MLADTPVDTLRDVLRWHLIRSAASSLAPAFDEENFAFYGRILGGQQAQQPRWKRVVGAASADVGEAVAQLFVHETFPPEAKARVETLVEHLLSAMGRAIRGNTWMTEATREEALRKLAAFGYKIGYPDRWRDYSGLAVDRDELLRKPARGLRVRDAPPALEARLARRRARVGDARARRERLLPPDRATRSCSRPGSCSRRSSTPMPTTR